MKSKIRNSSFELLRILSMFAIVMHHYGVHGTFNQQVFNPQTIGSMQIGLFLQAFGKVGVILFVMIGAYFLSEKRFQFRRPVNLALTMILYSFGIYGGLLLFTNVIVGDSVNQFKMVLLPFPLPSGYWFVYSYLFLLLAMPVLNLILNCFSQRKLLLLLIGMYILWSLLPVGLAMFNAKPDTAPTDFGYSYGTYFLFIYLVAGYVRRYSGKFLNSKVKTGLAALMLLAINWCWVLLLHSQRAVNYYCNWTDTNGPLILITAIYIFAFFKDVNVHSKFINYIAKSMFGVYLIHDNSFIRPLLWTHWISSAKVAHYPWLYLLQSVGYPLVIFGVCVLIDIVLRRLILGNFLNRVTVAISTLLRKQVKRILQIND